MFGLSFGHIILFGIIVLVFVGPEQLPEVARNLARLINELRRTTRDFQNQFTGDINLRQPWDQPLPPPPVVAPVVHEGPSGNAAAEGPSGHAAAEGPSGHAATEGHVLPTAVEPGPPAQTLDLPPPASSSAEIKKS